MTTPTQAPASSLPTSPLKRSALIGFAAGKKDGAFLARRLLERGDEVTGTSRDATVALVAGLQAWGVRPTVRAGSMAPNDFRSLRQILPRCAPDEVYNHAGQSSVGLSFEQPVSLHSAGSSECFGETSMAPASEASVFRPRSPYAVANACADLVANYREAYRMHACTGTVFNLESQLRSERFVKNKDACAASRVAAGASEELGNLAIRRDWGWGPELRLRDAAHAVAGRAGRPGDCHRAINDSGVLRLGGVSPLRSGLAPAYAAGPPTAAVVRHRVRGADPALALHRLRCKATMDMDRVVAEMCRAAAWHEVLAGEASA